MLLKTINEVCGAYIATALTIRDKNGKTLGEKQLIEDRWKECFNDLYNIQNPVLTEHVELHQSSYCLYAFVSLKSYAVEYFGCQTSFGEAFFY
jgi:hypothetical protein